VGCLRLSLWPPLGNNASANLRASAKRTIIRETWPYRGQEIGSDQIVFLREFIRTHDIISRWKLSRQLCEALGWKQANRALRDMVCRGLLLVLERAGQIELPPVRRHIRGQCRTGRPRARSGVERRYPVGQALEGARPRGYKPSAAHRR